MPKPGLLVIVALVAYVGIDALLGLAFVQFGPLFLSGLPGAVLLIVQAAVHATLAVGLLLRARWAPVATIVWFAILMLQSLGNLLYYLLWEGAVLDYYDRVLDMPIVAADAAAFKGLVVFNTAAIWLVGAAIITYLILQRK